MLDKSGKGKIKVLFWLTVLAVAGYAAYVVAPPYVSNYMLKIEVENQAKIAHMYKDEALASEILKKAEAWSVPISRENITISREMEDITIEVKYSVTFTFFGQYSDTQDMDITVHRRLATKDSQIYK